MVEQRFCESLGGGSSPSPGFVEFVFLGGEIVSELIVWSDRVTQWARDRNIIEGTTPQQQFLKLAEEVGELSAALQKMDLLLIQDSLGDINVMVNNIAVQCGLTLEQCQESAWNQIKDRKGKIVNGVFVKES